MSHDRTLREAGRILHGGADPSPILASLDVNGLRALARACLLARLAAERKTEASLSGRAINVLWRMARYLPEPPNRSAELTPELVRSIVHYAVEANPNLNPSRVISMHKGCGQVTLNEILDFIHPETP